MPINGHDTEHNTISRRRRFIHAMEDLHAGDFTVAEWLAIIARLFATSKAKAPLPHWNRSPDSGEAAKTALASDKPIEP